VHILDMDSLIHNPYLGKLNNAFYLHKDHIELRTSESRVEDNTGLPRRGGEPQFHNQGYHWKLTTSYQKPLGW
jgi:hypothetical protein